MACLRPVVVAVSLVLLSLPVLACRVLSVRLVWKPQESLEVKGPLDLTAVPGTRVRIEPVIDERTEKQLIAENREDGEVRTVTTPDDVPGFVTEQVAAMLESVGLTPGADADLVLSATLRRFFVVETNRYRGEVVVSARLANRSGAVLWEGIVGGRSERFGRSYEADNYQEALSDAVVDMTYRLLSAPGFLAALRSEKAAGSVVPTESPGASVATPSAPQPPPTPASPEPMPAGEPVTAAVTGTQQAPAPMRIPRGGRIFVEPSPFGSALAVAILKKRVPVVVVTDREKADFFIQTDATRERVAERVANIAVRGRFAGSGAYWTATITNRDGAMIFGDNSDEEVEEAAGDIAGRLKKHIEGR